jgi:hypothetical protein
MLNTHVFCSWSWPGRPHTPLDQFEQNVWLLWPNFYLLFYSFATRPHSRPPRPTPSPRHSTQVKTLLVFIHFWIVVQLDNFDVTSHIQVALRQYLAMLSCSCASPSWIETPVVPDLPRPPRPTQARATSTHQKPISAQRVLFVDKSFIYIYCKWLSELVNERSWSAPALFYNRYPSMSPYKVSWSFCILSYTFIQNTGY